MSEYWKSTPRTWCKYCKVYVRDTKLDKQQHDTTARHQANIQRSLRDLHKGHERGERDKQRAQDEIARLNGIISGPGKRSEETQVNSAQRSSAGIAKRSPTFSSRSQQPRQATAQDRKQQIEQLAALGVAVPEQYKKDAAMVGQWETVSINEVRPAARTVKSENEDMKPSLDPRKISIGVRKRKHVDEAGLEEEVEEPTAPERKEQRWGSGLRKFQPTQAVDFDALMKVKTEEPDASDARETEPGDNAAKSTDGLQAAVDAPVLFKKRKAKARG